MKLYQPLRRFRIRWMQAIAGESAYVQELLLHSSIHFHEDQRGEPVGGTSQSTIEADIAFSDKAMLLYHADELHKEGPTPEDVQLVLRSSDLTTALSVDRGGPVSAVYAYMPFIIIGITLLAAVAGAFTGTAVPLG